MYYIIYHWMIKEADVIYDFAKSFEVLNSLNRPKLTMLFADIFPSSEPLTTVCQWELENRISLIHKCVIHLCFPKSIIVCIGANSFDDLLLLGNQASLVNQINQFISFKSHSQIRYYCFLRMSQDSGGKVSMCLVNNDVWSVSYTKAIMISDDLE